MTEKREACGRCAMTTVVDATAEPTDGGADADAETDGDGEGRGSDRDPFGDARIGVDEATLRRASPAAWIGRVVRRLDAAATRFVRGR